ncbi:MAG TPA: ribonuclease III [Acidimicrobiia bacterium]|nr:ribonuclease III [Acidimicrobiia bacterium]HSF99868.1 ribonuclease III [Vicinamibacterales bacterium]
MSDTDHAAAVERLEEMLGYRFDDRELLQQALVHRSYAGEQQMNHSYERLEFLGDAVLQLAVTRYLFDERPDMPEGEMAKVRAAVVNERTLATFGRELGVGPALLLGKGEDMSGGREKDSLLSDVVEALVGAIFREAGYERAAQTVISHWSDVIDERAAAPGERDYKTRLQEHLARLGLRPKYVVEEQGPEHAKNFTAQVFAAKELLGEGAGTSKKRAEQAAAKRAAARFGDDA